MDVSPQKTPSGYTKNGFVQKSHDTKSKHAGNKYRLGTKRQLVITTLLVLLLAASVSGNVYQYMRIQDYKKDPAKAAQEEQTRITELVRKHYQVPMYSTTQDGKKVTKEDTPQIATITDITKMKGQAFFDKAQNGDYIVVFPNTKLALIYREKTDQIINSGPVSLDANQQASKLNVKILGSVKDRDAVEEKINQAFPGSTTIAKLDASGKISSTVVVDVTGKNQVAAEQLANKLTNATVGSVPQGQTVPTDAAIAIFAAAQ